MHIRIMPIALRDIANAATSRHLGDIALGYVYACAMEDSPEKTSIIDCLRSRLIITASETRGHDRWLNEINTLINAVATGNDQSDAVRRSLASTLMVLYPFVRRVSLSLAADTITTKRAEFSPSTQLEGERVVIGAALTDLSSIAESEGHFQLAADLAERASHWFIGTERTGDASTLADALDSKSRTRSAKFLGVHFKFESVAELAKFVQNRVEKEFSR